MEDPPKNVHHLIEMLDRIMSERSFGRSYPPLLVSGEGPEGRSAAVRLVRSYRNRLGRRERDGSETPLAPHALLDDRVLESVERQSIVRPQGPGDVPAPEPRLALLEKIADRFVRTMPPGSGTLHLPEFHTCLHVMQTDVSGGGVALQVQRKELEKALYKYLKQRRGSVASVDKAFTKLGEFSFLRPLRPFLEWITPTRWGYGIWLRRRSLHWVSRMVSGMRHDFLTEAVDFSLYGAERRNEKLMARILLTALSHDLARASRASRLRVHRKRRRWPFVLLFVAEADGPRERMRELLRLYAEIGEEQGPVPLMPLGVFAENPPETDVLTLAYRSRRDLDNRLRELLEPRRIREREAGERRAMSPVALPLPTSEDEGEDDGAAERWLRHHTRVPVPPGSPVLDWTGPIALLLVPVLTAAGVVFVWDRFAGGSSSCVKAGSGETVGVTDGLDGCMFEEGEKSVINDLVALAGGQNEEIDEEKPYKTVVFLAPLTRREGREESDGNAVLALRGAITAQRALNAREIKNKIPIRLLIANPGEYFAYGAGGPQDESAPDVAEMIVDRVADEGIVGVIGLTQSRAKSLDAVRRFDEKFVPTLGFGVTGSRLVDDEAPARYFQISMPNERIAEVLVSFAENSPQIAGLSHMEDEERRHAVVVYHPGDAFFSEDLRDKLKARFEQGGGEVTPVRFDEEWTKQSTAEVARKICEKVRETGGVVFYAGRSHLMTDLFTALQDSADCQLPQPIPVIGEALSGQFLEKPTELREYKFLKVFDLAFSDPGGETAAGYQRFEDEYRKDFKTSPDSEAAGGYDALNIIAKAVDSNAPTHKDGGFDSNDVYTWLAHGKLDRHLGATGVISLGAEQRYPLNKAVYVFEALGDNGGRVVRLTCGVLPDGTEARTWGPPGGKFPCPWQE